MLQRAGEVLVEMGGLGVGGTGGPKLIPRSHCWVTAAHPEESSLHSCHQKPSRAPSDFSHHPHFSRRKQKTLLLERK